MGIALGLDDKQYALISVRGVKVIGDLVGSKEKGSNRRYHWGRSPSTEECDGGWDQIPMTF